MSGCKLPTAWLSAASKQVFKDCFRKVALMISGKRLELLVKNILLTRDRGCAAQEEAFDIADRVVVFNRGRVEQEGEPAEVARSPASAFVMQFVSDVNTVPSASLVRPLASNQVGPVWGVWRHDPQHCVAAVWCACKGDGGAISTTSSSIPLQL